MVSDAIVCLGEVLQNTTCLKKKVLFVGSFQTKSSTGHTGGQMFACTSLVNSKLGESIDFFTVDTTASTNKARSLLERSWNASKRIVRFLKILLGKQPDTVLLFCSTGWSFREKALLARIAKRLGKKVILAPRSGLIKNDIQKSEKFKQIVVKTLNDIDILLCQGESWEEYYGQISENKKLQLKVIHNWIDTTKYPEIERSVKKKEEDLIVLFLGWITANKGIYEIIEAASLLKSYKIKFLLAGDGDAFDEIAELIEKKGLKNSVELLGWVMKEDKHKLLNKADVFILPSYKEGYPNALLEAMLSNLAVISTSVGAIPDLVIHDENGLLIKPGDSVALAKSIEKLYQHPELRIKLGNKARQLTITQNSIDNAVEKFDQIL